jgi:glycosyltransferase involved in cell wall biosynthesis
MKIGYIASSIYRHTFEINEVAELLRQSPGTRIYSFYRGTGDEIQSRRIRDIENSIITWSAPSIISGFFRLAARLPFALFLAAAKLAVLSAPNPVYWFKNLVTFFVALPILADANKNGITHLHANFGSSPATIAWLGKNVLKTSMSVTFHAFDIYSDSAGLRDPLKKRKIRESDLVVAVHRHGLEHLQALVPEADKNKFKMIHICVVFEPKKKSVCNTADPLFVAAGNLVPKKGFDVLIRAAGILKAEGAPVRVRILGEGGERDFLESLVRGEKLTGLVELPGYYQHADFAGHLAEAAALVVPSQVVKGGQRDGIPTVLVEAWLAQTPVLASLVGGMAEVLVNEKTGLTFPPGDSVALARCMRAVIESDVLRSALAENGLRIAQTEFSAPVNALALIKKIREFADA